MSLIKMAKITEAPVDLLKIAKLLDFNIISYPFPECRKGTVIVEKGVKAIAINNKLSPCVRRFTIAHELGHFVNGHQHAENEFDNSEKRFYSKYFKQEREADLFASELLMPKDFLVNDLNHIGLDEEKLIEKYIVSRDALWIRLNTLQLAEKYARKD